MEGEGEEGNLQNAEVGAWRTASRRQGECVVCLDGTPNMALLCCGAVAHMECLRSALLLSTGGSRCPHCREPLPTPTQQQQQQQRPFVRLPTNSDDYDDQLCVACQQRMYALDCPHELCARCCNQQNEWCSRHNGRRTFY